MLKMKKTGIITFHKAHNYGAMLQVYALSQVLSKSENVEVINYYNKRIYNGYKIIRPLNKRYILGSTKRLVKDIFNYNNRKKRYTNFNNFINTKCVLSKQYNSIDELSDVDYDVLITGSDQVWNTKIVGELSDAYTLNFGKKEIKRISYAASVGDASLIKEQKDLFKSKLEALDKISVREEDAKIELEKIIDKPIDVVLDPTLLRTKEEWDNELKDIKKENEKYILAYVVEADDEYVKVVNDLSKKTGLKVIHFGEKNPGYINVYKSAFTEGPLEFVNYIKNAEYVVATSFHATVFSIIFNKKFFIIPHRKTGARVLNLLDKLEIENRVFYSLDEFKNIEYNFESDWNKVNNNLLNERNKSINWLKEAIEG